MGLVGTGGALEEAAGWAFGTGFEAGSVAALGLDVFGRLSPSFGDGSAWAATMSRGVSERCAGFTEFGDDALGPGRLSREV